MTDESRAQFDPAAALAGAAPSPTASAAARTAVVQYAARVVGVLTAVVATSLVTRRLGTGYVDWATVVISVSLVAVLLEPGFSLVIVRRLGVDSSTAPKPSAMIPTRLGLGLLALIVVVGVGAATRGPEVLALSLMLGSQVVARSLINNATAWLQADQRLYRLAILEAAVALLGLAALVVGIYLNLPVPTLGAMAFTLPALALLLLTYRELRMTPSSRLVSPGAQGPKVRSVLVETAPLAVAIALGSLYTRSSLYFVNRFEDDADASKFLFAFLFAEQAMVIAGIAAGATLPLLAHRSQVTHLFSDGVIHRLLVAMTATGAVLSASLIAGAQILTKFIGGPQLSGAEEYIVLLAPIAVVMMPAMLTAYIYVSTGRAGRYVVFNAIGLGLNVLLNVALVPTYGAVASARIAWLTELMVTLIPIAAVVRSGRSGARAGLQVAALVLLAVAGSELVSISVFSSWVVASAMVLGTVAVASGQLRWLMREGLARN